MTNIIGNRNLLQKKTLCKRWYSPCLAFHTPGKTCLDRLASTVLAAALPMILSQSRCPFHAFQRTALHFQFVLIEKRKQVNMVSAVLAFFKRIQPCRRLLCNCQLYGCIYNLVTDHCSSTEFLVLRRCSFICVFQTLFQNCYSARLYCENALKGKRSFFDLKSVPFLCCSDMVPSQTQTHLLCPYKIRFILFSVVSV